MSEVGSREIEGAGAWRRCPWCAESIRAEALKCRHCGSVLEAGRALQGLTRPWVRPIEGRMLAGVCAGLADQFGISVTLVRLAFVLGVVFSGGVFVIVYLALWLAMPTAPPRERIDGGGDLDPGTG
jgi:phage shock protein PspC (stress-responsive transcriptional regulator)